MAFPSTFDHCVLGDVPFVETAPEEAGGGVYVCDGVSCAEAARENRRIGRRRTDMVRRVVDRDTVESCLACLLSTLP